MSDSDGAHAKQLERYFDLLLEWNAAYNLVAQAPRDVLWARHMADSLAVLPHVDFDSLLDLGAGAGFPGMVLAIERPGMKVTLADSNGKKTRFMEHARMMLGLDNVTVLKTRAEALAPPLPFAASICRAFTALGRYVAFAAPHVLPQAPILAMKGPGYRDELAGLPEGFELADVHELNVPGLDAARYLLDIRAL